MSVEVCVERPTAPALAKGMNFRIASSNGPIVLCRSLANLIEQEYVH